MNKKTCLLVASSILIIGLSSCCNTYVTHKPSKRSMKKSMRYSTSEYIMPTKDIHDNYLNRMP